MNCDDIELLGLLLGVWLFGFGLGGLALSYALDYFGHPRRDVQSSQSDGQV